MPKFPRNGGLFVRLPFPDKGRLQLVLVTPVGTQVGTQIGGSYDGKTGLRLRNLPAAVSDWLAVRRPEFGRTFVRVPSDTSRTV